MYVTVYKLCICQITVIFCKSVPGWNLVDNSFGTYSLWSWIIITIAHSHWLIGMWVISCARKAVHELLTQVEKNVLLLLGLDHQKSYCIWCKTNMTKSKWKKVTVYFPDSNSLKINIFIFIWPRLSMLKVYMLFGNMLEQTNWSENFWGIYLGGGVALPG